MLEDGLAYRRRYRGLIGVTPKVPVRDTATLSIVYTPGVARPCIEINKDPRASFEYTIRGNTIAVISDGSSVYGLGNAGPLAAVPMLEAKCVFHKTFAGTDAFPIAIDTRDPDEFVEIVRYLSATFGGFHIEDIASPNCFVLEERLKRSISLPILHADQQGAAVAVYAALLNALKVVDKQLENCRIVIAGAGAGGLSTAKFLKELGVGDVKVCDRHGAIHYRRLEGLNWIKSELARLTNPEGVQGSLEDLVRGADVFIGFAGGNLLTPEMVASMAPKAIVFALANPVPEIGYAEALSAGAAVVATGRSDFPNQLNASLVFPGIFRGALDVQATGIDSTMTKAAAHAVAELVSENDLASNFIVPEALDFRVAANVAKAVAEAAITAGLAQDQTFTPADIENRVMQYVYEGSNAWVPRETQESFASLEDASLDLHRRYRGMLEIKAQIPIRDHYIYNLIYSSPGASQPCEIIRDNPDEIYELTAKNNLVAIVTDGSAILGLGNLGPTAGLPVMEGKAVLFKTFGGVEAFPICLRTQEPDEIVDAVLKIAPVFGGINLEDISAPRCFEIEQKLCQVLDIPVFHDDQHGTAVVVLAGIMNAAKATGKSMGELKTVINGAGAAALSVSQLLLKAGVEDITICDTKGAIYRGRTDGMNPFKNRIAEITNLSAQTGSLSDVLAQADVFIGLSVPGTLTPEMMKTMAPAPIIFALANPTPEIMPADAFAAGASIVATGRSDFPNQVNNSLAFPGIFRGALDVRARRINDDMKLAAANAIASMLTLEELNDGKIIPGALDFRVPPAVAGAVARAAIATGEARVTLDPKQVQADLKKYLYEGDLKKTPASLGS